MTLSEVKAFFESELFEKCIPFWLEWGEDKTYGGVLSCLDDKGRVFSRDKGTWMQGRAGWTFSYLYNELRPEPRYLEFAKSAIDFAKNRCFLPTGEMSLSCTEKGKPVTLQGGGWFSEAFYASALAEYATATEDKSCLLSARAVYDRIFSSYSASVARKEDASDSAPRATKAFAEPMILINLTNTMRRRDGERAALYDSNSDFLIDEIKHFYSEEHRAVLERLSLDNEIITESAQCRVSNPGHDIECSWFLLEEAIDRDDAELAAFARKMFDDAYALGFDVEYGGILYNRDIYSSAVEAYEQDMKIWWVHNETVIASLAFYLHTGEQRYKDIFDETLEYARKHFIHESGEWYASLSREGRVTAPNMLGFIYKGPFHVPRMYAKCLKLIEKFEK